MGTRTIPTTAEVRAAVSRHVPADYPVRYEWVRSEAQKALGTTRQRSHDWITAALLEPESHLVLISTGTGGIVREHFLDTGGRESYRQVGEDYAPVILNKSGKHLGHNIDGSDARGRAEECEWIITRTKLAEFVTQAAKRAAAAKAARDEARERAAVIKAAYLEENHGDALAVLRGLCARADVLHDVLDTHTREHRQTVRAECKTDPAGTRYAEAIITLRDEQINALAELLAELGITPADEPESTTI